MNFIEAIILGIVQGAMEFLPISSSGHLVILSNWFQIGESLTLSIFLHLATFLSVCLVLRKELWELIKKPFSKKTMQIVVACACTFVIALIFKSFLTDSFGGKLIPYCFLITAILLISTQFVAKNYFYEKPMNFKTAAIVGIVQGFAILPGISRSGSTICAALLCKTDKKEAADFSFIISLPIILASAVMDIFQFGGASTSLPFWPMFVACVVAFIVGIFCVKWMRKLTQNLKLWPFAIYLTILGITLFFV